MDEKRYVVKEQSLKNLADQVRIKAGTTTSYDIDDMSAAISTLGMPELEELNVTENGEYTPTKYGYSRVTVDVQPPREEINITENGEYTPTSYGYSKVTVDVQPTLEELTVTKNGIYTPTEYGYSKVTVDCLPGPPDEAFDISGDCSYRFSYNNWNWFIENYGNRVSTHDISFLNNAFQYSTSLTEIPFDLNVTDCGALGYAFYSAGLNVCPRIRGTLRMSTYFSMNQILNSGSRLTSIEDLLTSDMLADFKNIKVTSPYSAPRPFNFSGLQSLRSLPSWWRQFKLCEDSTAYPNYSYGLYYSLCTSCYSLDEVLDMPVWRCQAAQTSDMFNSAFNYTNRLKDVTFETNNGQPIVTQWKKQTIDLSNSVGYGGFPPNYGFTSATQVTDDTTYQALKNDPDWWTNDSAYSRYDHDSAVRTINSLPDTSAYLATAGGTNTIKFRGTAGSSTDGGAINTLTAEEIAVATAKGWTVTLV